MKLLKKWYYLPVYSPSCRPGNNLFQALEMRQEQTNMSSLPPHPIPRPKKNQEVLNIPLSSSINFTSQINLQYRLKVQEVRHQ